MSSNPTLDLISKTAKDLKQLGFTNSKNEIIWYLEHKQLITLKQLYAKDLEFMNKKDKKEIMRDHKIGKVKLVQEIDRKE